MNKLKYLFLLCPLVALGQPIPPPATQSEVDAGANRFKYVTPFTLANTTIVGSNSGISAVTATNVANYHATNSALRASNTLYALHVMAVTNNPNSWYIWSSTNGGATNAYFAENRQTATKLYSNDFSGMLQQVAYKMGEGAHIYQFGNPAYAARYVMSNTVVMTNAFVWEGAGNPATVIEAAPSFSGAMIQLGSKAGVGIGGIAKMKNLRFQMDQGATNSYGVDVQKAAEVYIDDAEWTGYKYAALQFTSTNYVHWSKGSRAWFVSKWNSSKAIIFAGTNLVGDNDISQNQFMIENCFFGIFGGGQAIVVSNFFPNLSVKNSHFRYSSGTPAHIIETHAGGKFDFSGNEFQQISSTVFPIVFNDEGAATNYAITLIGNRINNYGAAAPDNLAYIGAYITNITEVANSGFAVEALSLGGNNGTIRSGVNASYIAEGTLPVARIGTGDIGPTQLASTAVAAGSYTAADITVDADGRITSAANGSATTSTNYLNLNAANLWVTNNEAFKIVEWGSVTNPVVDWAATNAINYTPSNSFTITQTGTVPAGWYVKKTLRIVNTNSTAGYFYTNDMNFSALYLLPAPSTNLYVLHNWGGIMWISSGQQAEIGTNAYMRTRTGVRRSLVVPAGYIKTNTTQGAIAGTDESGSNKIQRDYLDFDEGANTNANFSFPMPIAWDRDTVRVSIHWTSTNSATAGVVWKVASNATSDGDSIDSAHGSRVTVSDSSAGTANFYYISGASSAITAGNPASGAMNELNLKIERDYGNASDTLGGRIRLYYVVIEYTESIVEPAALP